jgi:hypothetical protein
MSSFELVVYNVLTKRKIEKIDEFISTYLTSALDLTDADMFYRVPIYLWLIDEAIAQLKGFRRTL